MFAEFIDRPVAGHFPEKHFGEISPEASWVKFIDNDYEEWVGSFAQNWEGYLTTIINFEKHEKTLVIACGNGYMIDTLKRILISDKVVEGITNAIKDETRQRAIFSNGNNLQQIDLSGNISVLLDKYFFDEIEFIEIKKDILVARYWYYQKSGEPFTFQINLLNAEIFDTYNIGVNKKIDK